MRLFIAILLPEEIKNNIFKSAKIVKSHSVKGTYPQKENYHITLAFLGDIEEERLPLIRSIMNMCIVNSFPVSVEDISSFHKKDGDIVHRVVDASRRLYNLQEKLTRLLNKNGFFIEKRPFFPHITIGRRVQYQKDMSFNDICEISEIIELSDVTFHASSMHLMLSEHISGKQKYTSIYEVTFPE